MDNASEVKYTRGQCEGYKQSETSSENEFPARQPKTQSYALKDGVPIVPSDAVYGFEIEEFSLNSPQRQIVKKSSDMTIDFVKKFQFLASDSLHGQETVFSFWAFNEKVYRRFQKYSDEVEAQEKQ